MKFLSYICQFASHGFSFSRPALCLIFPTFLSHKFSDDLDHILGVHKELTVLSFLWFFNALFALIYLMLVKDDSVFIGI